MTKTTIIKPNYNEVMALVSKDTRPFQSSQCYVVKGNTLVSIRTSKKKLPDTVADRNDDAEKFIKKNQLNLKERSDKTKAFAYYNNL
ncbi:hypothetical protein [Runella slithyformis]|uniref:hypothetical protein n=1 Tax=Runella slithyformis TaxID=106 RepID=UPI0003187636|nr:hypothetical protein [Runella slithyformis]